MVPRLRCNSQGGFSIGGLAPGPYVLFGVGADAAGPTVLRAELELVSDAPEAELMAQRAGSLSVRVARADGTPVENARIDIRSEEGGFVPASRVWLDRGRACGPDGRLELDDVIPGTYRIAARVDDRAGSFERLVVRSGATTEILLSVD
jgi:hypothetical protein